MGRGWTAPLLDRGIHLLDEVEPPEPSAPPKPLAYNERFAWGPEGANQGSPNHEAEAWSTEAVRAGRRGTRAQRRSAIDVLKGAYLPRELETVGLWKSEQLCSDAHCGQHLVGVSFARLAAWESQDAELLERTAELVHRNASLLLSVACPDLTVLSAGFRAHRKPAYSAATAWLRQLLGHEHSGDLAGRKAPAAWRSPFYLATRALRYLQGQGDSVVAPPRARVATSTPIPLKFETLVFRSRRLHLVVIPRHPTAPRSGVCDWLRVAYRAGGPGAVTYGMDWKSPPPKPPRAAVLIRHPGRNR